MNTTTNKAQTISLGDLFGVTACTRCGGSGSYSYCTMYGTTCFKCGGSGKQLMNAKFAQDAGHAMRKAQEPNAAEVECGDVVVVTVGSKRFWKQVASIERVAGTDEDFSSGSLKDGEWIRYGWIVFSYTDGTIERLGEWNIMRRRAGWLKAMPFCQFEKTRKMIEAGMARLKAERETVAA